MRIETKKGLLPQKPIGISYIYKKKSDANFSVVIINFTDNQIVRDLLFKYINSVTFKMAYKEFKRQLNLLKTVTVDEQIKILSRTIQKGWGSLTFEYKNLIKEKKQNYEQRQRVL